MAGPFTKRKHCNLNNSKMYKSDKSRKVKALKFNSMIFNLS